MKREDIVRCDNEFIMHTYNRLPLVPESADGATIRDCDGREFIDFTSGIGVNCLGWNDEGYKNAVKAQLDRYQHVSNYFYSEPAASVAEKLIKLSGMKKVFFGNSGAEANEGAIKLARKYSFDKYGEGRSKIISLVNSFHGRTVTTLSATGQDKFHKYFDPFTPDFDYVETGDITALSDKLDKTACAVMLEIIQGEGGVNMLGADYLKNVEALCRENDILLIVDEVQTGCARTGYMFAYQMYGLSPDIVSLAKGLGGGLPIGAFLAGEKTAETISAGMHGSTFGGNPISCSAADYVLDVISNADFLSEVNRKGEIIRNAVISASLPTVREVRGAGLMIGIEIDGAPADYLKKAFERGLLVLTAGSNVVRLLPPLNISDSELEDGLKILLDVLKS